MSDDDRSARLVSLTSQLQHLAARHAEEVADAYHRGCEDGYEQGILDGSTAGARYEQGRLSGLVGGFLWGLGCAATFALGLNGVPTRVYLDLGRLLELLAGVWR
jgi:hypothetical protein